MAQGVYDARDGIQTGRDAHATSGQSRPRPPWAGDASPHASSSDEHAPTTLESQRCAQADCSTLATTIVEHPNQKLCDRHLHLHFAGYKMGREYVLDLNQIIPEEGAILQKCALPRSKVSCAFVVPQPDGKCVRVCKEHYCYHNELAASGQMNVTMHEDNIYRHEGHPRIRRIRKAQGITSEMRRRLIALSKPSPSGNRFACPTNEQFINYDKKWGLRPTGLGVLPSGRYRCPECADFGQTVEFDTEAERDAHLFAVTWKFILLEMRSENGKATQANVERVSEELPIHIIVRKKRCM